ncbi:Por secretion system C-terminal sorting domain-containing protein [Lutibacter oricola]|uniref:Por secretion system C-terminal sorting domain-containing protein n=1 Tax=Lutibacter oricola TaxID=762486 RepID=A0A1H3AJD4_9FLAO|nr:T9SS type A sorting domain-containing protein [Lutibacter oricola]SDX29830.1 Por secretion system C-terminal sorting domain-containing protein [Lutibacter oricola]
MKVKNTLFLLAAFFVFSNIFSKDIYVAKNGNDSNPGTEAEPYLTISKAASVAVAGDIVFIKEGTYEETVAPSNSGSAGNPIVFQSYPGDQVIISAMEALSGWTQEGGGIYKTTIPFASLGDDNFVMNGETACVLARWPNKTSSNPFELNSIRNTGGSDGSVSNGAYLTESSIPGIDWTGGAVFFYGDKAGSGWLAWKETVTSSSSGRVNFNLNKSPDWIRTFHAPADLGDFYLEGVKEALDYENEWYFDSSTKELFIQLPNGGAPVDGVVKMRRRSETINIKDKKYIEIKNLAVFGGSINMEDSSTWQNGGNNRTTNNKLYGVSSFYGNHTLGVFTGSHSGKASLNMQGSNNIVERCEVAFGAGSGLQVRGNNHQIIDSRIHDFNYLGSYDAPLVIRGIYNTKIKNNEIFNGGRDGIGYYGENNELSYNDISRSNLIADDCALFYTVGRQDNTEIHHNWFHDAASSGTKTKAAGIYLDNDAAGFSVHHNVVWNTEWSSIQINWNGEDIDIFNNTLWNGSQVMGAWHKDGTSFTNVKVWNNLGSDDNWEPQSDKQNNLMVESTVFNNADSGDFNLKAGSTPVDAGRVIDGITDGYIGANPDVGAYEHGGDNWVAGITWDANYGPTGLGCYGLPGEECILLPKDDQDNDGVADANDDCPDTPAGTTVNTSGCPVFDLAAENFKVLVSGENCASSNNGSISITSVENLSFTAKLEETGVEKNFTTNVEFTDLSAGDYKVCITTTENAEYIQCFNITVKEPEALSVSSKFSKSSGEVTLTLDGADKYKVELNGVTTITDKSELKLNLSFGQNNIKVTTDLDCQGEYLEKISLFDTVLIYPNSVQNNLTIALPNSSLEDEVTYKIVSFSGQIILSKTEKPTSNKITVNVENLINGIYFIHITSSTLNTQSKIIKQ